LGAAIALGAAAALLWRWRVRVDRLALWGLGHFLVSLLPILGLVPFGYMDHSFVADHFVYVAAVGVFLALAVVIERAVHNRPVRRWVAAGIAGLVLIGCVVLIRAQLPIWRDPLSFWSYLAAHNPRSDTVHNNLGNAYLRQNQLEEAVRHYRQALQIKPNSSLAQMNLGTVFHQQGRLREAIDHYRLAIDYQPESWLAHYNLALAYAETGQSEEAVREAEQAVAFARKRGRTPEAAQIEAWITARQTGRPAGRERSAASPPP
jgi:tetratricopeptide (TPR) repeat protein